MVDANTPPPALPSQYQPEDLFVYSDDSTRYGEPGYYASPDISDLGFVIPLDEPLLARSTEDIPSASDVVAECVSDGNFFSLPVTASQQDSLQLASAPSDQAWNNIFNGVDSGMPLMMGNDGSSFCIDQDVATMFFQALSRPNSPLKTLGCRSKGPTRRNSDAKLRLVRTVAVVCMLAFRHKSFLASAPIFRAPNATREWPHSAPSAQLMASGPTLALSRPSKRPAADDDPIYSRKCQRHQRIQGGYPCELCPGVFDTFADRNKHKSNVHALTRPHPCSICQKAFCTPKDLRRHEKTHIRKTPMANLKANAVQAAQPSAPSLVEEISTTSISDHAKCHACQAHLPEIKCTPEYVDIILAENESLKHRCRDLESEVTALRKLLLARAGSVG